MTTLSAPINPDSCICLCFKNCPFMKKPLLQIEQLNGAELLLSTWVFLCLLRLSFLEKYFLHIGHENSFFPVCDTICLIRCSFLLKDLLQPCSSQRNGLSPTWDLRCCIRCSFRLNVFEQTLHAVKLTPPVAPDDPDVAPAPVPELLVTSW